MKTLGFCVLMVSSVLLTSSTWADSLYRCPDGTFTNKAERQCPPYESKGMLWTQSTVNGQQTSEVRTDDSKRSFAEVTLYDESGKKSSVRR
jgi:hypothetical protein